MVSHDCVGAAQVRRVLLNSPWTGTRQTRDAAAVNSISHKLTNKSNDRYDGDNKDDNNKVYLECVAAH